MKQLTNQAFKLLNEKHGSKAQIIKTIEELAELQQILCHYLNKDVKDGSHEDVYNLDIAEEIADVQIVTGFLIQIFNFDQEAIDMIKRDKLNRVINNNK